MKIYKLLLLLLASLIAASGVSAEINDKDFAAAMERYLSTDKGQESMLKFLEAAGQKQQELARKKQMESMAAKLEEQFKNPVKIDVGSSPVKGPANAKVTVVEFSDFQCPYCKRGRDTVEQIVKAYPNDVKVVFKNLPLPFHPEARPAAKAALAAGKQGKFWEMYDALFDNQDKLGAEFYVAQAGKLGLNVEKFKKDSADPAIEAAVTADEEVAKKLGISGTPSFAVNGVEVRGAYPFEHFKTIIDRWLEKK